MDSSLDAYNSRGIHARRRLPAASLFTSFNLKHLNQFPVSYETFSIWFIKSSANTKTLRVIWWFALYILLPQLWVGRDEVVHKFDAFLQRKVAFISTLGSFMILDLRYPRTPRCIFPKGGCVKLTLAARGRQEAGFTQPPRNKLPDFK